MGFDAERYYQELLRGEHFDELVNLTDSQLEQLCIIATQHEKIREAAGQLN